MTFLWVAVQRHQHAAGSDVPKKQRLENCKYQSAQFTYTAQNSFNQFAIMWQARGKLGIQDI
jgi:hypothetical protein